MQAASNETNAASPAPARPGTTTPPGAPAMPARDKSRTASPALLAELRVMIDACEGLLTRLEAEETLRQIHFDAGAANHGDIGQVRVALSSEVRNDRLNAKLDVSVDDVILSAVPADVAGYVPRHIEFEPAASGVPTRLLLRLLRDATTAGSDQPDLGTDVTALLDDPDARVGIESLAFSSGPLRMTGSGLLRKQHNGKAGINIHLVATGVDALIAEARGNPSVQTVLPMVFMAKGMARSLGDGLVWDIALGDGVATVNGVPFGQPPPGPPASGQPPSGRPPPDRQQQGRPPPVRR